MERRCGSCRSMDWGRVEGAMCRDRRAKVDVNAVGLFGVYVRSSRLRLVLCLSQLFATRSRALLCQIVSIT